MALGTGVPSAVTASNYPQDMVWQERNHIWAMIEGAWEQKDWTMIQHNSEGEILPGPPTVPKAVQMPHNDEFL